MRNALLIPVDWFCSVQSVAFLLSVFLGQAWYRIHLSSSPYITGDIRIRTIEVQRFLPPKVQFPSLFNYIHRPCGLKIFFFQKLPEEFADQPEQVVGLGFGKTWSVFNQIYVRSNDNITIPCG
jgi:hypothetical protein